MRSHHCQFTAVQAIRYLLAPFLWIVLFASVVHLVARLGSASHGYPSASVANVVLLHQWESSARISPVDLICLGDSSCLMDVNPRQMSRALSKTADCSVLNLGTLSLVTMDSFAEMVQRSAAANPDRLQNVLLLVHPEMLRNAGKKSTMFLNEDLVYDSLACRTETVRESLVCLAGLDKLDKLMVRKIVPQPLPNNFGTYFGFVSVMHRHMDFTGGSAVDPSTFKNDQKTGVSYSADSDVLEASRRFRLKMPANIRLTLGLTPIPAVYVKSGYREEYRAMLEAWSEAIKPDAVLRDLPPTLPGTYFATHTHLNPIGARVFTKLLANSFAKTKRTP